MNDNRFVFDARTLVDGFFPMPPGLSKEASELLNRFLLHHVAAWPELRTFDHKLAHATSKQTEDVAREILQRKFPMPCEGGEESTATIDKIGVREGEIHFTVNSIFAAYLLTASSCSSFLRDAMSPQPVAKHCALDGADWALVVQAVRREHFFKGWQWTDHAIHAALHGYPVLPREAFGLPRLEELLQKLGVSTAP